MATITKRGRSYRIIVSMGYDVNGNQVTRSKTWRPPDTMTEAQAKKEATKQAMLFENECSQGMQDASIKFQKFAEQWIEEYAKLNHRSSTLQRDMQIASRVFPALGYMHLNKISSRDIQRFINSLAQNGVNKNTGGALSRKTITHHLSFISSVFEYAIKMDMLTSNPCKRVTIPKYDANGNISSTAEKKIYTKEQTRQFIEMLDKAEMKYKVFFTLAIYTGCRRGELMGLEWKDIDLNTGMISISRTSNYTSGKGIYTDTTKTRNSLRTIYIPQNIIELLRQYQKEQNEYKNQLGDLWKEHDRLFTKFNGEPMSLNAPYTWLRKQCKKIDFPFYGVHTFRHLNASLQINAGVDPTTVAASLGHSTPQTTLSIYSHFFNEAKIKASNAIAEALGA